MKKKNPTLNLDFIGFSTSLACAVHCSVLPAILALGIWPTLEILEHGFVETFFIGSALIMASLALVNGIKKHNSSLPLRIACLGFVLITLSRFVAGPGEMVLTTLGGIVIATAHWLNWKLLQQNFTRCIPLAK